MNQKDLIRILIQSGHMANGIVRPEDFHKWLLEQYTEPCIQCKGHGYYTDREDNKHDCVMCKGLGVLPRKKVAQKKNCTNCDHFETETTECNRGIQHIMDPHNTKCAMYSDKLILAQME